MKHLIPPESTPRAKAYELWMQSPMPMVTLTKTMDITHLLRYSRRHNLKLNMLMRVATFSWQNIHFFSRVT